MTNLDVNYLNELRNTFNAKNSASNDQNGAHLKVKKKLKHNKAPGSIELKHEDLVKESSKVTFSVPKNKQETSNEPVKNRVATPPCKPKQADIVTTEHISPSLCNNNTGRGIKRRLSPSNTEQEVTLKHKKENTSNVGIKLNFDDETVEDEVIIKKKKKQSKLHLDETMANLNPVIEESKLPEKRKNKKKKKHKKQTIVDTLSLVSGSPVLVDTESINPTVQDNLINEDFITSEINIKSGLTDSTEIMHNFYDNEKINVKGMKFRRFCNLFAPCHDEQLIQVGAFRVPRKFYKNTENDNYEWNIEERENIRTSKKKEMYVILNKEDFNKESENIGNIEEDNNTSTNNFEITPDQDNIEETNTEIDQSNRPIILKLNDNTQIIIIPEMNQSIYFHGLCYVKVLNGEVEILGANLNKNSDQKKLYSPRGTSLLNIKNTSKLFCNNSIKIKDLISENLLNKSDIDLEFIQHSAILLCRELKEPYIDFVENHISQIIFPEIIGSGPRVDFELAGSWNKIQYSEVWENALENIEADSKTVICGGKGVGKSTFLRYAVNVLLNKFKKIRIVELDSGQSEFFAPGCIGCVTVAENILGPNYTHLKLPDRLLLSHINIGYNRQQYLKSVKSLINTIDSMEIIPTLINFPGFTQGIGLDISVTCFKLLKPTLVIELKSKSYNKNYKMDMTAENVNNYVSNIKKMNYEQMGSILNYAFVKFDSLFEKNEAWSLEARQSREICILSYFGKMMSENVKNLTCHNLNMFTINISALNIVNFDGNVISPLTINGCIVALCSVNEDNLFVSYGLGFIRGMDLETDILVLITPENDLEKVSHLVLSSLTTPPTLIMSVNGVKGNIPFVNVGDLVDFGQFTKRSYLPATPASKRN